MLADFLYRNPGLYEQVFPSRNKSGLCLELFERHLGRLPDSILEVACGTGRDLRELSKHCADCVGFDVEPEMVAFARGRNPALAVSAGDMRTFRAGRQFDAICALGGSINFALTNDDLEATVATYAAHAHSGTLLVLQPLNPGEFFGQFKAPETFSGAYNGASVVGTARYTLNKLDQIIERDRSWTVEGEDRTFSDNVKFRVIFPGELRYFLERQNFEVLDLFEAPGGSVYTSSMFVVARMGAK